MLLRRTIAGPLRPASGVGPGAQITRWLKRVAPYAVLGLLVPGGGVAAVLLWSSRHGGSYGVALTRTVRTATVLIVALALPSSL